MANLKITSYLRMVLRVIQDSLVWLYDGCWLLTIQASSLSSSIAGTKFLGAIVNSNVRLWNFSFNMLLNWIYQNLYWGTINDTAGTSSPCYADKLKARGECTYPISMQYPLQLAEQIIRGILILYCYFYSLGTWLYTGLCNHHAPLPETKRDIGWMIGSRGGQRLSMSWYQ